MAKKIASILLITLLTFFLVLSAVIAEEKPAGKAPAKPAEKGEKKPDLKTLIAKGDALFNQRTDLKKLKLAKETFEKALKLHPNRYELLWKLARAHYHYGRRILDDLPKDTPDKEVAKVKKEQEKIFDQGVKYAQKAAKKEPKKVEGHFWLAVCYGVYGEARGIMKSLFLVDDIKEETRKALAIDETFEDGGPHRVLGRVYFKIPWFVGGSNSKSLKHLRRALELGPKDTLNYLYLAEVLIDEDEEKEAREILEKLVAIKPDPKDLPEALKDIEKGRELLKKLKD
jgi:tetratricopeptide (TPR) repeat protein